VRASECGRGTRRAFKRMRERNEAHMQSSECGWLMIATGAVAMGNRVLRDPFVAPLHKWANSLERHQI